MNPRAHHSSSSTAPAPLWRGRRGDPAFLLGGANKNTRADESFSLFTAERGAVRTVLGVALVFVASGLGAFAASEGSKLTPQELDFFERNIRPVLSEKCYKCHSTQPDAKLKGGLDLGTREGLQKGGDNGASIVPGKPGDSLLIKSLKSANEDELMPPKKEGGKLKPEQIAVFEQWVKMGAPDPRSTKSAAKKYGPDAEKAKNHPFFNPVKPVTIPMAKNADAVRTPVDNFILAKLEAGGLSPAKPADKRTLIRRASFDLLGLPPTPEEVDAFLADKSPKAYEKVIERLLASPHYGERWGRYWLDVARYGDTLGDTIRNRDNRYLYSFTYRDYVIKAFNDDKPYDQFITEQIAADRLPLGEDKSALAALGFLTLGNRFQNDANQIIDDRIDVICRGTMGLTAACARCHDHKFDPITMKDYYALHGVLNSVTEPAEPPLLRPVKDSKDVQDFTRELEKAEAELAQFRADNERGIITNQHARVGEYLTAIHDWAHVDQSNSVSKFVFFRQRDLDNQMAAALERHLKKGEKKHDPVFAPWIALSEIPEKEFAAKSRSLIAKFAANSSTNRLNPHVARLFALPTPSLKEVAARYGHLFNDVERQWQMVAASKKSGAAALPDANYEVLRQVLYSGPMVLDARDIRRLTSQTTDAKENLLIRKANDIRVKHPGSPARAMALVDVDKPRDSAIFLRGNANNRGAVVPRQFLEILAGPAPKPFKDGSGRLDLARSITAKENPLTARVMVNRIWFHHFGQGIVASPSDFGLVGEPPSHPELLDWLARQFMEHGWSVKKIHRLIMLSGTYQQSSDDNPRYSVKDQGNTFLWRQNRARLDFEAMRDTLLAVAGTLDRTMGGQPVDLVQDPAPTRRTVYGFINRAALPEFFNTFDFAPPDISSPKREATTVPQQALYLLNAPFVIQQAKALSERSEMKTASSDDKRIRALYRVLYQREPSREELRVGVEFIKQQTERKSEAPPPPALRYGYGSIDPVTKRVKQFTTMPTFEKNSWHAGKKLSPLAVDAAGGTTGIGPKVAAVRRWVSPRDGFVTINGQLTAKNARGSGVQGSIISSRGGEVLRLNALGKPVPTLAQRVAVKRGDTIDFVVEAVNPKANEGFTWAPNITMLDHNMEEASNEVYEWHAQSEFAGPPEPPLKGMTPWEKYAQVMLLSNELIFVN
ncbi:MAG: PSD1 domain-containing protein [Verrucomicrobia bacterium]|nr:PSD1 domain-containing protein [Verrucomicrobiota bacterium]